MGRRRKTAVSVTTKTVLEANEIKQSNYITTARYDYSPTEKRILYRVVEKAWEYRLANAEYFKSHDGELVVKKHVEFTMPITAFMTEEQYQDGSGKYYQDVVGAFKSLVDKRISFIGKDEFSFGGILNFADKNKGEGTITFMVHKFVWQSALNFTRGFTKLDLEIAMQFKCAYTMRFFELIKEWQDRGTFTLSVQELREMFGCQDKYPLMNDFKRYVIDKANKELDDNSYLSFDYYSNKVGREIRSFTFTIKEVRKNLSATKEQQQLIENNPEAALPWDIRTWIINKLGIEKKQLYSNMNTFYELYRLFPNDTIREMEETFQYIINVQGKRPQTNVGLFITNLKAKIKNEKERLAEEAVRREQEERKKAAKAEQKKKEKQSSEEEKKPEQQKGKEA